MSSDGLSLAKDGDDAFRASVSDYYGATLQSTADLKTSACCPVDSAPAEHRSILSKIHPEVLDRFYGCGSPIPDNLTGATVLDLGCGTGRDVYLASALVGKNGKVIGVDMTDVALDVARRHRAFHADALLGPGELSNVEFRNGVIENLAAAGVTDSSVDVVISNCVCNLSPDKPAVFKEVARVLRDGGEFYFSDIYADRRLSLEAQSHPVLVGECLGGALYIQDFRRAMAAAGLPDVRVVSCAPVAIQEPTLSALVPGVNFYSITVRAFKAAGLEDRAESYGQTATYTGLCGSELKFDATHNFPKGVAVPVDANTATILSSSRYSKCFTVTERGPHEGLADAAVEGGAIAALVNLELNVWPKAGECCQPGVAPNKDVKVATGACSSPPSARGSEDGVVSGGCCQPPAAPSHALKVASGSCCPSPTARAAEDKDVPGACCQPTAVPAKVENAASVSCCPAVSAPVKENKDTSGGCCRPAS
jgi:arsenite methyltransferase